MSGNECNVNDGWQTYGMKAIERVSDKCWIWKSFVEAARILIKGLKETTHGYKKNETKLMISRSNCNAMFLFFLTADSQILRNVRS